MAKHTVKTNRHLHLLYNASTTFSKQPSDIGNGKRPVDAETNNILFQLYFEFINNNAESCLTICHLVRKSSIALETYYFSSKNKSTNRVTVNCVISFLNSLNFPALPPHKLSLKIGASVNRNTTIVQWN